MEDKFDPIDSTNEDNNVSSSQGSPSELNDSTFGNTDAKSSSFCSKCGAVCLPTAKFCSNCGASIAYDFRYSYESPKPPFVSGANSETSCNSQFGNAYNPYGNFNGFGAENSYYSQHQGYYQANYQYNGAYSNGMYQSVDNGSSSAATTSMVFGIISLATSVFLCGLGAPVWQILGLVFSGKAKKRAFPNKPPVKSRLGFIFSLASFGVVAVYWLYFLLIALMSALY